MHPRQAGHRCVVCGDAWLRVEQRGKNPEPQVWKGGPVMELINDTCNFASAEQTANAMAHAIKARGNKMPAFYFYRIVWVNPTQIGDTLATLRKKRPDLNFVVLDSHTFFALFKESRAERQKPR